MFGIGGFELFIIILFGFLIFGPDKLPEIAKTVGMAINKFKKAKDEMDGVIKEEIFDPTAEQPFKNPVKAAERAKKVVREVKRDESQETFAERKARYDRERAEAKKRAQLDQEKQAEIDANRAKMKEDAAKKAEAASVTAATAATTEATPEAAPEATPASTPAASNAAGSTVEAAQPKSTKPTTAELYGTVPMNKQFVRKPEPAAQKAEPSEGGER